MTIMSLSNHSLLSINNTGRRVQIKSTLRYLLNIGIFNESSEPDLTAAPNCGRFTVTCSLLWLIAIAGHHKMPDDSDKYYLFASTHLGFEHITKNSIANSHYYLL